MKIRIAEAPLLETQLGPEEREGRLAEICSRERECGSDVCTVPTPV
ncbi:hypothetical protein IB265_17305 [Ensifer sp. ENS10]|nr:MULTISPECIES: hypothetical protein [unclassified Ensifer]MBD9508545.1 hypothetical protein [Ensifer sp. ENS10]MBV7518560.1 hypothetical protein [Ensifer sp. ENS12]